jgi:hypothetical protein
VLIVLPFSAAVSLWGAGWRGAGSPAGYLSWLAWWVVSLAGLAACIGAWARWTRARHPEVWRAFSTGTMRKVRAPLRAQFYAALVAGCVPTVLAWMLLIRVH